MVLRIGCMLHYGRLIYAWCRLGGGEVFGVPGIGSARSFADIAVTTGVVVGACRRVIVYNAIDVATLQHVLRMDQVLSQRAASFDGG